jgi:hypothetical protein
VLRKDGREVLGVLVGSLFVRVEKVRGEKRKGLRAREVLSFLGFRFVFPDKLL